MSDGNQLPPAGETACPTYFAKRLIQQGGAGGFACRSNGHNQWSASKMNNKPLPHTQLQSKSYAVERSVRLLTASPGSAAENLLFDEFLLSQREEALRFWECSRPVVVLGHGGRLKEQVRIDACAADGVEVLRRGSGGGAVVLGPGCLNYSLIFSLEAHPAWRDVRRSVREILGRMAVALEAVFREPSDLACNERKVSGNSQHRIAGALLHHGTLLYRFDAALAARYLLEPTRQPEYRRRRPHSEFLGNLPYSAVEIQQKVAAIWCAGGPETWGDH